MRHNWICKKINLQTSYSDNKSPGAHVSSQLKLLEKLNFPDQSVGLSSWPVSTETWRGCMKSEIVILVDNWKLNYQINFSHQVSCHEDILTITVGSVVNIFFSKHCKYLNHLSNCCRHLD